MMRKICCILLVLWTIFLLEGCGFSFVKDLYLVEQSIDFTEDAGFSQDMSTANSTEEDRNQEPLSQDTVFVHVCGCVKKPGLYHFTEGERVDAAIQAAGGFAKGADQQSVNLAELLVDGEQIVVASSESARDSNTTQEAGSLEESSKEQKVNINAAEKEKLMTLHGIGEGKALSIIAYREEHGAFSSIEDIKNVNGIGETIYNEIKNMITVR